MMKNETGTMNEKGKVLGDIDAIAVAGHRTNDKDHSISLSEYLKVNEK